MLPVARSWMLHLSPLWWIVEVLAHTVPQHLNLVEYNATVHVGIAVVDSPRNHCNELAFVSRFQMQRKILCDDCSCWEIKDSPMASETDKLL